jgi:hypothetical protein
MTPLFRRIAGLQIGGLRDAAAVSTMAANFREDGSRNVRLPRKQRGRKDGHADERHDR